MPTRNRRAFVAQSLRYFARQDWPQLELIIVDDGDDPVADLVTIDPRIHYERLNGRHTIGHKRNLACAHARGEWIAHWDDDDWYPPWRLRRQAEALAAADAQLCGSSQQWFWQPDRDRAWEYVAGDGMLLGASLFYAKTAWQRSPFLDVQIAEDIAFVHGVLGRRRNLATSELCIGIIHETNVSPKPIESAWFRPRASDVVHQLVGNDRPFYLTTP
jgi:glycosyltransferase involved in cell wall biosynthesis